MAAQLPRLRPTIWKACAGLLAQIPVVNSLVYYFPQGHAEHACSPPLLPPAPTSKPSVLCHIVSVEFFADPHTDEVFSRVRLQPLAHPPATGRNLDLPTIASYGGGDDAESHEVVSYTKVLTSSDANNGGGFSVPRSCADSVFPPLNFQADPPVQTLSVTDAHGVVWDFRHIYRGTPRRHLLTTGWSRFVNQKKLIAGDSIVFIRDSSGKIFAGVRRAIRSTGTVDHGRWSSLKVGEEEGAKGHGFSRNGNGKVSAEAVVEAVGLAVQGMPFEIEYYPRTAGADFVVRAEAVDSSMARYWIAGTRVKLAMETADSSKITWLQGTVSSVTVPADGPWKDSPWRMLQVAWDEPEVLPNVKGVSPWVVEYDVETFPLCTALSSVKRTKVTPDSKMLVDEGEGETFFPMTRLSNAIEGQVTLSMSGYHSFSDGMQGARQDSLCVPAIPTFFGGCTMNLLDNMSPKEKSASAEQHNGRSQSMESGSSVHLSSIELVGNNGRDCYKSFKLFGKTILINRLDKSDMESPEIMGASLHLD